MATFTNTWNETIPQDYSTTGDNEAGKVDDVLRDLMLDVGERILKYAPVGIVIHWPSDIVPIGWLECDGSSLARADYPELFSAIGTYHGAEDLTKFNIPDIRGYFTRGWDNSAGVDPDSATRVKSSKTGASMLDGDHVGTIQQDEFFQHGHNYIFNGAGSGIGGTSIIPNPWVAQFVSGPDAVSSSSDGGTESTPKNIYVKYIIRAKSLDYDTEDNLNLQGIRSWDESMPIDATYMGRVARYIRWRRRDVYERLNNFFPTGKVSYWPSETVPDGWLECNGAEISRTTYAGLFSEIGTAYGPGDGYTTFNLPDYRGYFLRAQDSGTGVDSMVLGRSDGDVVGSLQDDEVENHSHVYSKMKITTLPIGGFTYISGDYFFSTGDENDSISDPHRDVDGRPENIYMMAIIFARGVA